MHDTVEFERRGVPAICIVTDVFEKAARAQARLLGLPEARIIVVEHPLSTLDPAEVEARAHLVFAAIEELFSQQGGTTHG